MLGLDQATELEPVELDEGRLRELRRDVDRIAGPLVVYSLAILASFPDAREADPAAVA